MSFTQARTQAGELVADSITLCSLESMSRLFDKADFVPLQEKVRGEETQSRPAFVSGLKRDSLPDLRALVYCLSVEYSFRL